MPHLPLQILLRWLKSHPGVFSFREEGDDLRVLELFSGKEVLVPRLTLDQAVERSNAVNTQETYINLLFHDGRQLVLSPQGFAFPPDFGNTGPLPLPNPVYCMQDYQSLMRQLRHVAAEPDRGREALQLVMVLIAILDGAKAAGLEVDAETQAVDEILTTLEKGERLPPPH
ncbi:MAG TPA: hypothetical protein DF383_09020 [Deltaproteobacteria bacterium]|nr:hypothetical protein [Deltaproteobacteria bacterium]